MPDTMAAEIQRDYLEKLYYFSLKKTGSRTEAEDLAQDIASQALLSLANGSRPADLGRWIWTIARNRYARWAKEKKRRSTTIFGDGPLAAVADEGATAEEQLLLRENLALLRRELSLLASGYREIIVAYYFDGERIGTIARRLGLPEGTVKRKLHECRTNMREGIEMAREVGVRSFKAENIWFSKSGRDGDDGSPWKLIQRLIPKNILFAAYRNPLSLEELCLELGISMPYMEEEVKLLVDSTLLKEVASQRFETDFIIVDKDMQREIFQITEEAAADFAPRLIELLDKAIPELQQLLEHPWDRSFLLWTLIPMAVDFVAHDVQRVNGISGGYTKRPHEGHWDIVGYEDFHPAYSMSSGNNNTVNGQVRMAFYKIGGTQDIWDRAGEMSSHEVNILASVIQGNRKLHALGTVEQEVVHSLANRSFIKLQDDDIILNFVLLKQKQFAQISHLTSLPVYTQLQEIMDRFYKSIYVVIGRDVPARLNEQLKFVSGQFLYNMRTMGWRHALEQGDITLPDDPKRSTIAMYMTLG
ncbi:RNA polymerase sigma factor [Paenibacillus sp. PR3]|uniref:RNA polymerase sigma factor n=1 Tax=Paenibacillus terricola TaxID=2763503 RepID=A0ABR8N5M0_9BACL|nr:RNA polymerase sigma factor [Paenibacillus terricola]MBD3922485.1 RNA polymerase sigma factor [Paenibacillus terricola]